MTATGVFLLAVPGPRLAEGFLALPQRVLPTRTTVVRLYAVRGPAHLGRGLVMVLTTSTGANEGLGAKVTGGSVSVGRIVSIGGSRAPSTS